MGRGKYVNPDADEACRRLEEVRVSLEALEAFVNRVGFTVCGTFLGHARHKLVNAKQFLPLSSEENKKP